MTGSRRLRQPAAQLGARRHLEREGDIEGAIEIYETLYAANSNNLIIANNLASLCRPGARMPKTLTGRMKSRAACAIAMCRPFQDTYGWIAFRRGDLDTALSAGARSREGLLSDAQN